MYSAFTNLTLKLCSQTELDEIESRNEEFPLTRALLHLLDVLTDVPVPRLLGAGCRTPGFDPYLHFIIDSVFLKFNNRSYKNPEEKWQVATCCLKLLVKFLKQYEPRCEDFFGVRVETPGGGTTPINPPPGYHIMISLNNKSELLRLVIKFNISLDLLSATARNWIDDTGRAQLFSNEVLILSDSTPH